MSNNLDFGGKLNIPNLCDVSTVQKWLFKSRMKRMIYFEKPIHRIVVIGSNYHIVDLKTAKVVYTSKSSNFESLIKWDKDSFIVGSNSISHVSVLEPEELLSEINPTHSSGLYAFCKLDDDVLASYHGSARKICIWDKFSEKKLKKEISFATQSIWLKILAKCITYPTCFFFNSDRDLKDESKTFSDHVDLIDYVSGEVVKRYDKHSMIKKQRILMIYNYLDRNHREIMLCGGNESVISIYDVRTTNLMRRIQHKISGIQNGIYCFSLIRNKYLLFGDGESYLRILDISDKEYEQIFYSELFNTKDESLFWLMAIEPIEIHSDSMIFAAISHISTRFNLGLFELKGIPFPFVDSLEWEDLKERIEFVRENVDQYEGEKNIVKIKFVNEESFEVSKILFFL